MAGAGRAISEGHFFDRQLGRPGGPGIRGSYDATGRGGPQVTGQRAQPLSRGGGGAATGGMRAPGGAGRAGREGRTESRPIREAAAQKNLATKEGELRSAQQREAPRAKAAGVTGVGRGGFGPEPGRYASESQRNGLQARLERSRSPEREQRFDEANARRQANNLREQRQDQRERRVTGRTAGYSRERALGEARRLEQTAARAPNRLNPLGAAQRAEAREDYRARQLANKKTLETRAAREGRAHRPGYRGNTPQNPTILT